LAAAINPKLSLPCAILVAITLCAWTGVAFGQSKISASAYRVLGQSDLSQNGLNRLEGVELSAPGGIAIDARGGAVRLYVSDSGNHRILAWPDARSYQAGDPPALVLGQPDPRRSGPLGIGDGGLLSPAGIAIDPNTGNLYVADSGNHRVLRFPAPFANPSRVEPDMVYGQPEFQSRSANAGGVGRGGMNGPFAVAFDAAGNLWVADTGNHRILRFGAAVLESALPEADTVIGQKDFAGNGGNRGGPVSASSLNAPAGLAFDHQGNLLVSDFGNARILRFAPPFGPESTAVGVFGQSGFTTGEAAPDPSSASLVGPAGLGMGPEGNVYVAVPQENRVLAFAVSGAPGSPALNVFGQSTFTSTAANAGAAPRAAAHTLSRPADAKADPEGNIYVADAGNHRVLVFRPNSRSAAQVWGQIDLTANGPNQVKPGSVSAPYKMAVDYSRTPYPLYVSDANNNRVLIWKDSARFRDGDPADLVIGQPDMRSGFSNADTTGGRRPAQGSLSSPRGLAVDSSGNLYVADSGNHRILRYPQPIDQGGRILPDAVIGQPDFTSSLSAAVTASSLRQPSGVALAPDGALFVADTGNNRVLEYAPGAGTGALAIRVYGQPGFSSGAAHAAVSPQTLSSPTGIAVDAAHNLYVADYGANRVVVFPNTRDAPTFGPSALIVIGNDRFDGIAAAGGGAKRFRNPIDVALASTGDLYVSDSGNNRVLAFPSLVFLPIADAAATAVVGQRDFVGTARNWNSAGGRATGESLAAPLGIYLDRRDTLYVGDAGNSRVAHFLRSLTVRHAANPQSSTVPLGGLILIEGAALADEDASSQPPLPYSLAGREIVINYEVRAPLLRAAPGSFHLQLPTAAPAGRQRLAVRVAETAELIAGSAVSIALYAPGLYDRVLNQDGTVNSSSNTAIKGSTVRLTGAGQGPVSPVMADGNAAPEDIKTVAVPTADGNTCLNSQPSVCVAIGNLFGEVQFSGLAPNAVGTWQIDVKIPANAPSGSVPVRAVIAGVPSNIVNVSIR
jgi:uncharacterized protein (TIGR03437 family)